MSKMNKGNHSIITWEDRYYDGFELDCFDHRDVSDWMLKGAEDCYEYIEKHDDELIWLKNEAQKKYYREPNKATLIAEENKLSI
ncbi:hypothetical protein AV545_04280 [Paenibacillus jamilae]|uniref:hypothetical protein n=1 Tax=Paenibacillus jamilae TaxID=114136 RepID=UPI0007AB2241|nr:hypothetical protein [Paenibacillus jamilae]KZE65148.1 hypothetical protein AV545_04280 [Paenibacillus jamilae]